MGKKKEPDYIWRVTKGADGEIGVAFGPKLSDAPFDDTTKLHILGKSLMSLGAQLAGNSWSAEDDDDDL